MRYHGNEVVLLFPRPSILKMCARNMNGPTIVVDMETKEELEVTPDYGKKKSIATKSSAHLADLRDRTQKPRASATASSMTDRPLDAALRQYLTLRGGRTRKWDYSLRLVPRRTRGPRASPLPALAEKANHHPQPGQLGDVL